MAAFVSAYALSQAVCSPPVKVLGSSLHKGIVNGQLCRQPLTTSSYTVKPSCIYARKHSPPYKVALSFCLIWLIGCVGECIGT